MGARAQVLQAERARRRAQHTPILRRLPQNEALRPYVHDLMGTALAVMRGDCEDNALICHRLCFDLHKTFRPGLEDRVPEYLEFVTRVRVTHVCCVTVCVCVCVCARLCVCV